MHPAPSAPGQAFRPTADASDCPACVTIAASSAWDEAIVTPARLCFAAGAASAFVAVAAGAFGAHALRARVPPELLAVFEVGVRYQMYHALALLACGWAVTRWPGRLAAAAAVLFLAGTLVFSGRLYALALTGARWLGAVTPFGGLALLAGWLCLAAAAMKS